MRCVRLTCVISGIVALWVGVAFACITAVGAAGPVPSLVAQAGTAPPGASVTVGTPPTDASATAASASAISGTSFASPPVAATVETGSAVPPPEPLPVVDTSSGPNRGQVIIALIGIAGALIVIPLTAWGLIRLIATAG